MTDYERFGDYSPQSEHDNHFGFGIMFLFIGLGIGAITALLFAPKAGKRVRRKLRRHYEDARDAIDDISDQAGDYIDKGKRWSGKARDRVSPVTRVFSRD
jgi:gas vesicle protein